MPTNAKSLVVLLVGPVVLGIICGLTLGLSAPAYWIVQIVAVVGTILGTKHATARQAIPPAALSGFVYGGCALIVRAITGWEDKVSLGELPILLCVITTIVAIILASIGATLVARRERSGAHTG